MNDSTESAHAIRADIQETRSVPKPLAMQRGFLKLFFPKRRNNHLVIRGFDKCDSCGKALLSRGFYRFPCSHSFHSDCLWKEVTPYLKPEPKKRAEELQEVGFRDDVQAVPKSRTAVSEYFRIRALTGWSYESNNHLCDVESVLICIDLKYILLATYLKFKISHQYSQFYRRSWYRSINNPTRTKRQSRKDEASDNLSCENWASFWQMSVLSAERLRSAWWTFR